MIMSKKPLKTNSSLFNNDPYFKSKQSYNNIIISQTLEMLGD